MKCRQCGSDLTETNNFCKNCGTPVETNQENISINQNYQKIEEQSSQINNQPYPTEELSNNNIPNGNDYSNNKFIAILPLILGILSIVFLFITPYIGFILGISTIIINTKVKNNYSKKGQILGVIGIGLCFFNIAGHIILNVLNYNVSDKELNGQWSCITSTSLANITSENTASIWSEVTFNNGNYTLISEKIKINGKLTGGTTRSGKYRIKPSTINQDAWETAKEKLEKVWNLSDKSPKPFMLSTNEGPINAIKIYTTTGDILMLYTNGNSYVCWSNNSENTLIKDNNNTNSNNQIKGEFSREIFSGQTFEYKTSYDTATFIFNSNSTFTVSYKSGETYKGDFEIYNGLYIGIKADKIAEDSSIKNADIIANDIKNVSNKMMDTTESILNTYLIWLKTDTGILQPFVLKFNPNTNSGTAVNILGQTQGTFTKK